MTFLAAAYADEAGRPQVDPNLVGKTATPSIVRVRGDRIIVGVDAMKRLAEHRVSVIWWNKRSMAGADCRAEEKSPAGISAQVLRTLKAGARLTNAPRAALRPSATPRRKRREDPRGGDIPGGKSWRE
jgi:molecular chaperone DnaK (HSP70)